MKGLSRLECGKGLDELSDEVFVAKLRHCASNDILDDCQTCPGGDEDDVCFYPLLTKMMLFTADRIEKLSRRLDETAGIALKLQERLDEVTNGAADQMD